MRLSDLPNHHLDVLIEIHVIGSRVRKSGRDGHKVDQYVRAGASADPIPEWSSDEQQSMNLVDLYLSRLRPLKGLTPRDRAIEALKKEGL